MYQKKCALTNGIKFVSLPFLLHEILSKNASMGKIPIQMHRDFGVVKVFR